MSKTISVIATAKFPKMKPSHHAFITKQGTGTSIYRASRDMLKNLFEDERLKGKRVTSLCPYQLTINSVELVDDEEEN